LDSKEIGYNYSFAKIWIEHLLIYSSVIPVFIEIVRPMFLLLSWWKVNKDPAIDGINRRDYAKVSSVTAMEFLSVTKFINYNSQILN